VNFFTFAFRYISNNRRQLDDIDFTIR